MKKIFAVFIILSLTALVLFSGCLRKMPLPFMTDAPQEKTLESKPAELPEPETFIEEPVPEKHAEPDAVVEHLLKSISSLDRVQINALIGQYFGGQEMPDEYFALLKPISERLSYEIGEYEIDGDKAAVKVSISAVDAKSAINSIMSRAVTHLAAMQLTGKDVSNPELILADYAAQNIKWDEIPIISTDSTLYLAKDADGEWMVDASNPDNFEFANAVSSGAVDIANNLKSFTDRYK